MEMDPSGKPSLMPFNILNAELSSPCSNSKLTKQASSYHLFSFTDLLV